jgi:hypothetical protein
MLIKAGCHGIGCVYVDVIHLAAEIVDWLAVLGSVMNIHLP